MSTVKSKKLQVGTDATSSNNFTIYQPATPDGTLRIGVGNADSPTEVGRFTSAGYKPATAPLFRVGSNATQAISANTWTKVDFGAEFTDTNNNFASSRFTPTVAGYYFVTARVGEGYTGSANQVLYVSIYKNGNVELRNQSVAPAAWYDNVDISGLVYCNGSTDYIEIYFYTSASGYTKSAAASNNYFHGYLVQQA